MLDNKFMNDIYNAFNNIGKTITTNFNGFNLIYTLFITFIYLFSYHRSIDLCHCYQVKQMLIQ